VFADGEDGRVLSRGCFDLIALPGIGKNRVDRAAAIAASRQCGEHIRSWSECVDSIPLN